ncbi:MAG: ORC1-type DNA replication protein [Candidatus Methanofastidiosia archaeon]
MKIKDILLSEETLIKNYRVFDPAYTPERFNYRESQLKSLAFNLKPALKGGKVTNTLILGPPGTGKTTSVRLMFKEVEETSKALIPVYINCQLSSTPFTAFSIIHKKIRGFAPPASGVSLSRIKKATFNHLSKKRRALVVALDDIDHLFYEGSGNKILYSILRAHESYPHIRASVFGILSDNEFRFILATKVSTVFNPQEVYFPPYTLKETYEILKDRKKLGLVDDCLSEKNFEYIVKKTCDIGDLRIGIELLLRSALEAEGDASKKIEKKHIGRALNRKTKNLRLSKILKALSEDEKLILKLISENGGEDFSGELFKKFHRKTKHGEKKFSQILKKLENLKIIDTHQMKIRGNSRRILLRFQDFKEFLE